VTQPAEVPAEEPAQEAVPEHASAAGHGRVTSPPPDAVVPAPHPEAPAPGARIGSHYSRCFGCGDDHRTGLHMRVVAGEGLTIHADFTVTGDHQGAPGLAHGGLLSCAFDEALGSLVWLLRRPAVTGRLETDFVRPVPVGSQLYITAECVGVSGRKIYTRALGRLGARDGPVAVRARGLFVEVDIAHFRSHGRVDAGGQDTGARAATTARQFEVNP